MHAHCDPADDGDAAGCARRLEDAQNRAVALRPTSAERAMSLAAGYAVQRHRRSLRSASGDRSVGFKIGLTSEAARASFSAAEPICGPLIAGSVIDDGGDISLAGLICPKLEVEVAFVLASDLAGSVTPREVLDATAELAIAFEIIDSRWQGGADNLAMLVADNSFAARAVVGPRLAPHHVDLRRVGVALTVGETRIDGHASNVMGDPAQAVAWLAGHLAHRGEALTAGQIVLSGTLTTPIAVQSGDVAVADFGELGQLRARFTR